MRGSDKIYVECRGRRIEARMNHFQACEECGQEVMVVNLPGGDGQMPCEFPHNPSGNVVGSHLDYCKGEVDKEEVEDGDDGEE